jgi:hypothetical protein
MAKRVPIYTETYFDDLGKILNLSLVQREVLKLLIRDFYSENIMMTNNKIKRICENIGITRQTFRNMLSKFIGKKILIRKDISLYMLNPAYNPMKHTKSLTLTIKYVGSSKKIALRGAC